MLHYWKQFKVYPMLKTSTIPVEERSQVSLLLGCLQEMLQHQ